MLEALRDIIDELIAALGPLVDAAQDPEELKAVLADLGWTPNSAPQPLLELAQAGAELVGTIGSDTEEISPAQALGSVKRLVDAINAIRTKPDGAFPSEIDVASFKETIARDLLDYVLVEHLLRNRHQVGGLLKLAGLIRLIETPATGLRQAYLKREVVWSRIGDLLADPAKGFREGYDWDSATPRLTQAIADLASLLESNDLQLSYFEPTGDLLTFVNAGATMPLDDLLGIDLAFDDTLGAPDGFAAGVQLLLRPPTASRGPAISFLLYAFLKGAEEVALSDTTSLSIRGDADFTKGIAITLAPGHAPDVQAGFLGGMAVRPAEIQIGLKITPPPDQPEQRLIGAPDASRLAIKTASFFVGARLVSVDKLDAFVGIELEDARVVIKPAPDEADAFLASLLGKDGISASLSFGVRLSSVTGFHLTGSGGLEGNFPLHTNFGPISVQSLSLGLKPNEQGIEFAAGATVTSSLGPLAIAIEGIGFKLTAQFPDPPTGNLGPIDVGFGFMSPKGIGLAIDAQVVTGAGYLEFYPDRGEYLGAAQLRIKDKIQVKAIGLILTKPEVSFLLLVSAEFPPVQLGLGFKLNGVGGLAGIHRGINEEQLFAGLRDNTLDDLLFPADPLKNIHGLLGKLNGVFPPAEGRYTFGLMGLITWGPQDLVTIKLGLIVEFPTSLRLVVVGTLKAAVTKTIQGQEISILHLQVNFAGLIDFDEQFIRFDAALYQSTLLGLALEGEMALRLKYGANPDFVMTLGGFHPDFQPPALRLPADLRRLQITLRSGNPHIWIDAYLAVTANTFQFGAGGHLRFSKWGVRVAGDLGFDALFQFSPFRFEAGVYFRLSASWKGHEFASIEIDGVFSGPSPWRIRGQFKLKICWFLKISVSFDESWGEDDPTLLGLVDVLPLLVEDLRAPANWERTPGRTRLLVTARQSLHVNQNGAADLWLHPNDLLTVRQNTVPLGLPIDKFSEKRPQGASRFTVALQAADGTPTTRCFRGRRSRITLPPGSSSIAATKKSCRPNPMSCLTRARRSKAWTASRSRRGRARRSPTRVTMWMIPPSSPSRRPSSPSRSRQKA